MRHRQVIMTIELVGLPVGAEFRRQRELGARGRELQREEMAKIMACRSRRRAAWLGGRRRPGAPGSGAIRAGSGAGRAGG